MGNKAFLAIAALQARALAQNCPSLTADYPAPSLASGYEARLVAQNLNKPRGLIFDNNNNLLVVEREVGVTGFKVDGSGSCVTLKDKKTVVSDGTLNHGIELSQDGKTLYASSRESVLKYNYDGNNLNVNGKGQVIVKGMTTDGQVTRTLLLSKKSGNKLLVSRGSDENIDLSTVDVNAGQSQIRIFDPNQNDIDFAAGITLGWGLRNAVGLAENPKDGGIWSTENNADNIARDGIEIHENNPAEELNYHGKIEDANNPLMNKNYGYPLCYGAWDIDEIPSAGNLQIGDQFALADENATRQDEFCNDSRQKPRLVFQPHTSPIDIKFDGKGENLYVSLRGSWNREDPVGYSVSVINFGSNGEPSEGSSSRSALHPIFANSNTTACPANCFRPTGLAFDRNGRLYVASDATGEIYVITKSGGQALDTSRPNANAAGKVSQGLGMLVTYAMMFAAVYLW